MTQDGIGVLLLDAAHPYPTNWPQVAGLALGHKLAAISEIREFVLAGGLMSYIQFLASVHPMKTPVMPHTPMAFSSPCEHCACRDNG